MDTLNINVCPICGNNHFLHELHLMTHFAESIPQYAHELSEAEAERNPVSVT